MARHDHDPGWPPPVTTPQGTLENGVVHGHEEADVHIGPIIQWFTVLAVFTVITCVGLWAAYGFWESRLGQGAPLPSPLFAVQLRPAKPRVLPNPQDAFKRPLAGGPGMVYLEHRRAEDAKLMDLGFLNKEGQPFVPLPLIAQVRNQYSDPPEANQASGPEETRQPMPSDASGGTVVEDRLK